MTKIDFTAKVRKAVTDFEMVSPGDIVYAALSGGADSVSLLYVLRDLREELGITLRAVHINHRLRGEESDRDMLFCEELCGKLGVPLEIRQLDLSKCREKHESLEECARKARYDAFSEVTEGYTARLATAHNANDCAETVLLNIMRGTGLKGLCGIPPTRNGIIRPLIYCSRAEVEEYCGANGLSYVTDSTNLSDDYTRNRVRRFILPEMLKINGSFLEAISRMTGTLREDSAYLETLAEQALTSARTDRGWRAAELAALPKPVRSRAVKKILSDGGIEPSALRINTAMELLNQRSARFNPCRDRFFTIRKGICYVEHCEQHYRKNGSRSFPDTGNG